MSEQKFKSGQYWYTVSKDYFKASNHWFNVGKKFFKKNGHWYDVSTVQKGFVAYITHGDVVDKIVAESQEKFDSLLSQKISSVRYPYELTLTYEE